MSDPADAAYSTEWFRNVLFVAMGDGGGADDRDGQLFTTAPPAYPPCGQAPIVGHNSGSA